jgi:hypothetical protein
LNFLDFGGQVMASVRPSVVRTETLGFRTGQGHISRQCSVKLRVVSQALRLPSNSSSKGVGISPSPSIGNLAAKNAEGSDLGKPGYRDGNLPVANAGDALLHVAYWLEEEEDDPLALRLESSGNPMTCVELLGSSSRSLVPPKPAIGCGGGRTPLTVDIAVQAFPSDGEDRSLSIRFSRRFTVRF